MTVQEPSPITNILNQLNSPDCTLRFIEEQLDYADAADQSLEQRIMDTALLRYSARRALDRIVFGSAR